MGSSGLGTAEERCQYEFEEGSEDRVKDEKELRTYGYAIDFHDLDLTFKKGNGLGFLCCFESLKNELRKIAGSGDRQRAVRL